MTKLSTKIAHIIIGDIVSKGFGFILTIYLTRVLGTEGYGMVTVAMAYLGYAVFFGDYGLYNIGSREVAKPKDKRQFFPIEILTVRMILATSIFCIAWFALPYILVDPQQLILTRRYLITLLVHAYLVEWFFNGIQRYDVNAISRTIQSGVYAIGSIIIINDPSDILNLPILYIVGYFISAVMLISLAFKNKAFTYRKIQLGVYFNLLKSSSSVGSGMLFAHVIQLLPPIVIGIFLSTSDAGLYGAAYRLILIGMLLDRLFVQLLIPNLSKQWSENKELTLTNMEHISRIMLSLGAIVSVFIAIGASDISSLLFGDEFVNSAPIIIALSLYLFITFQNSMFSHGLVAIGKDVQFLKATSISGVIAILLIVSSSIYFNSMFVGLAVAISELCITFMCYYWFKKSLSFNYVTPFFFTLIIGIGIYFGSTFIHLIPIVEALLATIVLGIALLSFRVLRLQDLRWLKVILIR